MCLDLFLVLIFLYKCLWYFYIGNLEILLFIDCFESGVVIILK